MMTTTKPPSAAAAAKPLKSNHGKLRRVRLEFEDGHAQELIGDDADRWLRAVDGALLSAQLHHVVFPHFDWKHDCICTCAAFGDGEG